MNWLKAHWIWVVTGCVAMVGSFGAGRYSAPTKEEWRSVVSIQTNEVEVEKVVERIVEVKGPIRTVTRTVERVVPSECAGVPPVILHDTETIVDSGPTTTTTDTARDERRKLESTGVTATEHTVTRDAPRLTILGTFGTSVTDPHPVYGGQIMVRVLGPLTVGAGFDSSLRATVAAGLTF
jgi:hypothetical protein